LLPEAPIANNQFTSQEIRQNAFVTLPDVLSCLALKNLVSCGERLTPRGLIGLSSRISPGRAVGLSQASFSGDRSVSG
jgi:hypothetical protein